MSSSQRFAATGSSWSAPRHWKNGDKLGDAMRCRLS